MGLSNVGLTINSMRSYTAGNEIAIDVRGGTHYQHFYSPKPKNVSEYWMMVFDRKTLKAVENFMFTDNSAVPTQITPYLNDTNYFYVLTTQMMRTNNLPTGNLYKWLKAEGAGDELTRVEQAAGSLNCGSWATISYTFVDLFGPRDASSIEFSDLVTAQSIMTLELAPLDVGGTILYTPVKLG